MTWGRVAWGHMLPVLWSVGLCECVSMQGLGTLRSRVRGSAGLWVSANLWRVVSCVCGSIGLSACGC